MAGELVAVVKRSLSIGGITIGGVDAVLSPDSAVIFEKTIPAGTDQEADIVVDVSQVNCMGMTATKDCTVCTNDLSSGSPTDTIVLLANQEIIWKTGDPDALKF